MPYDYRRMSPEERAAVIDERRTRGYPLHAPPHPYRGPGSYFISAATFEHAHVISTPARLTAFEEQLLAELSDADAEIGGWVILTNHYHVLVGVESFDQISAALQHLHGSTSRQWNLEDGLTGQRKVWYRFRDRCARDERQCCQALNYMHYNPVKHGYVDSPYEWPWSSVHLYHEAYGRAWLRDLWTKHPIRPGLYDGDEGAVSGLSESGGG